MSILVREIPKFQHNGNKGAFRAWLRQVAANRLRSVRRKQQHSTRRIVGSEYLHLAKQLADPSSDLTRLWDEQHNRQLIRHMLKLVKRRFRDPTMTAFRLIVLDEQPADEVARQLGLSVNAVRIAQAQRAEGFAGTRSWIY